MGQMASAFLRLERIIVNGLFGIYDHDIRLKLSDRITFLHGPNGVGKTVILGMINALLRDRLTYFQQIPFSRFVLEFDDHSALALVAPEDADDPDATYTLHLVGKGESHSAEVRGPKADAVAADVEFLQPGDAAGTWLDMRDGEVLSATDVISRFSEKGFGPVYRDDEDAGWFERFLGNANTHLIAAQRLVRLESVYRGRRRYTSAGDWHAGMISNVMGCGTDFRRRLDETMTQYGRQAQTLDQSFPQRLLSAGEQLPAPELKEKMTKLEETTTALKKIGLLDETPEYQLPFGSLESIDPTRARVMTLYVRDTNEKLQVLEDLASRARLLLDTLNRKYRYKRIRLDREEGFVAENESGQKLALNALSSGEQQELVLHYDLLFKVPSNTIVLIDEPELSLHVAWQKSFLPDLLKIVELSDFDALVATHSPYIVGDRDDLMVGLGEVR